VETRYPGEFTDATRASGRTFDENDRDGDWGTCTTELASEDIAFALGRKGLTRRKLERASSCIVQFVHDVVYISGFKADRQRAQEYLRWLFDQLEGPMHVSVEGRRDASALDIPQDAVGYITGNNRETLTRLESECGVLTFFVTRSADCGLTQRLLMFGPPRGRIGLLLEVMRLCEAALPGYFSRGVQAKVSEKKKLDTERILLSEDMVPRLLGKHGETARVLAAASGAILQYIGSVCWVAGTFDERRRCLDYVRWVRDQVYGRITIDTRGRSDVTEVYLPSRVAKRVAGTHCEQLRKVERESQCLMILAYDHAGGRRLCLFSCVEGNRQHDVGRRRAERLANQLIHEKLREHGRARARGARAPGATDVKVEEDMSMARSDSGTESYISDWDKVDWDS